jgi:stage IV sporulation protein FB
MLKAIICGIEFRIGILFPAALVILFAVDNTGIPAWCLAASAMHEAGHFIAMFFFGCRPSLISIGGFGVRVEQSPKETVSYNKSMIISLAGPAVNLISFVVLFITSGMTLVAAIHLLLAVFNLLPIEYLDGGQFLYFFLAGKVGEEWADRICFYISLIVLIPLATIGFYLLIRSGYNFTLLAVSLYLGLLVLLKRK